MNGYDEYANSAIQEARWRESYKIKRISRGKPAYEKTLTLLTNKYPNITLKNMYKDMNFECETWTANI